MPAGCAAPPQTPFPLLGARAVHTVFARCWAEEAPQARRQASPSCSRCAASGRWLAARARDETCVLSEVLFRIWKPATSLLHATASLPRTADCARVFCLHNVACVHQPIAGARASCQHRVRRSALQFTALSPQPRAPRAPRARGTSGTSAPPAPAPPSAAPRTAGTRSGACTGAGAAGRR
jgi:hypothetical protein